MCRLGIVLACDHYPLVSDRVDRVDAQLRCWLDAIGIPVGEIEVFAAHEGEFPKHGAACDVWVVSGVPLTIFGPSHDHAGRLHQFLRAAAALDRTILGVHHAEHTLHAALAAVGAEPPATSPRIMSIRNPFQSFRGRDTLHRFDPVQRRVVALQRPTALCPRRLFGFGRHAA